MQTRPPFRPAAALAMLGGDVTLLSDMAGNFVGANPRELLALEAAVLRRDSVAAEVAAVAAPTTTKCSDIARLSDRGPPRRCSR
jgi:hypothetical protein